MLSSSKSVSISVDKSSESDLLSRNIRLETTTSVLYSFVQSSFSITLVFNLPSA
ncbi:MAG: hypothetical protein U9Q66_00865 [Patescibacteria group bacterium]|nr:hypothetical protein [Patescibacteria group bacterium]